MPILHINVKILKYIKCLKSKLWKKNYLKNKREILYSCGTEIPGTSELLNEKREGVYVTADKELPVFKSEHKFESGTGWPSFYEANHENIILKEDRSHGMIRTEVSF